MITEITDLLGTTGVSTKTKPFDVEEAEAIYLHLFDNGDVNDSARYKVSLNFILPQNRATFIAPILNHFEPARWLRSVNEQDRQRPFYKQFQEWRRDIRNEFKGVVNFTKEPSAGFFYNQATGHNYPYDCAYAYMLWQEGALPQIGFRFFDYVSNGMYELNENEYKGSTAAPAWRFTIKDKPKKGMINGW